MRPLPIVFQLAEDVQPVRTARPCSNERPRRNIVASAAGIGEVLRSREFGDLVVQEGTIEGVNSTLKRALVRINRNGKSAII